MPQATRVGTRATGMAPAAFLCPLPSAYCPLPLRSRRAVVRIAQSKALRIQRRRALLCAIQGRIQGEMPEAGAGRADPCVFGVMR